MQARRQPGDLMSLSLFFQNKESGLRTVLFGFTKFGGVLNCVNPPRAILCHCAIFGQNWNKGVEMYIEKADKQTDAHCSFRYKR
jgi:hypothetical protein